MNKENGCNVCFPEKRAAIKVNEISVCHECLHFFKNMAGLNRKPWTEEVEHQTAYIAAKKYNKSLKL